MININIYTLNVRVPQSPDLLKSLLYRNSDGSETVSVTKQLGDQSYNLVTTRDKTGATSSEENLTNISEADIETFKRSFDMRSAHQPWAGPQQNPRQDMIQTQPPLNDSTYFKLWDKFFGK